MLLSCVVVYVDKAAVTSEESGRHGITTTGLVSEADGVEFVVCVLGGEMHADDDVKELRRHGLEALR